MHPDLSGRLLRFFPSRRGQRLDAAAVRRTGHSPFSWLLARDQGLPYRRPLALTTTGRRTGRPHTIAISHGTTADGAWTVVASNGGADREPHWLLNLRDDPLATVHVARRRQDVQAEILHGDEKRELWAEITARAPVYARYQAGTSRDIAVVVLRPVRRLEDAAATAAAPVDRLFRTVAAARHRRALHPLGVVLAGRATVHPSPAVLATAAATEEVEVEVLVRLSRGAGLPHPAPDFNGIAIRLVDAHGPGRPQDLLLTSAFSRPLARHVLRPSTRFSSSGYSSILPHRTADGRRLVFRCEPLALGSLADVDGALPLEVRVLVARPLGGWVPAATVRLDRPAPEHEHLRFDPWSGGDDLRPAGVLNRLRLAAYAGSREGAPHA